MLPEDSGLSKPSMAFGFSLWFSWFIWSKSLLQLVPNVCSNLLETRHNVPDVIAEYFLI
jgi:hypothetical protein